MRECEQDSDGVGPVGLLGDLETVRRALAGAREMMTRRDEMNAAVHLAPVRYSPVTEVVVEALAALDRVLAGRGDRRTLVVSVDAETYQRLERLSVAAGTAPDAAAMAEIVLGQYVLLLSGSYCFDHRVDGCGDASGRHADTTPQSED